MRVNELMIGDWVRYNEYGLAKLKKAIARCNMEQEARIPNYFQIGDMYALYKADDYEGIPITRKILEKNGFKVNDLDEWVSGNVVIDFCENEVQTIYIDNDTHVLGIEDKYVHELQHALRLCKIDKEIKL